MKAFVLLLAFALSCPAATLSPQWNVADTNLARYFSGRTKELGDRCLSDITSASEWNARLPMLRAGLADMLGLSPLPPRGDLKATVTGRVETDEFTIEKLHFQSLPQLYVTANLYIPKNLTRPAPTVVYVCGHGPFVTNGVSYGTKVSYQHHGIWFARNGYVCMVIDTLESGEILGEHHGTHRRDMWWWNSRGYTPAGVEVWNNMRAIDYLSTRPEVDTNRFAITGRSGGGAYSWYTSAMDQRIKCAAPVAGITDLENHVVDGAVEGHCDCMFMVNTYRWDYPQLVALVAPRPLLFCNTDADSIFPLDGVVRTHAKARRIYDLLGATDKIGLVITPGGHKDTQELQLPVMRWFNQHLRNTNLLVANAAVKLFSPQELKVFNELPRDAINSNIHASFVATAPKPTATSRGEWRKQADAWKFALRGRSFYGWPEREPLPQVASRSEGGLVELRDSDGLTWSVQLPRKGSSPKRITLRFDDSSASGDEGVVRMADFMPAVRDAKKQIQLRRRFMLLGETVDSRRVWQIVQTVRWLRTPGEFGGVPFRIEAEGSMAVNATYASLFAPVDELVLARLPSSHMQGPDYLNVLRILDIPQAVGMATEHCRVELREVDVTDWSDAISVAKHLGWEKNLVIAEATAAAR